MPGKIKLDECYLPSADVVARIIEGELIIVPLVAGIGDLEDELFALNETGQAIWNRLDGKTGLRCVIQNLAKEYQSTPSEIEKDVLGLAEELLKRRMIVAAKET